MKKTKEMQNQEREFVSLKELKARGGANKKFFELLESCQNRGSFKKEWNGWVVNEGKNELLRFNNFCFDSKNAEITETFKYLIRQERDKECYFDFSSLHFPETHFCLIKFQVEVYFRGVEFQGMTNFDEATFQEKAHFNAAKFQGEASFVQAKFQGEADFRTAKFQRSPFFLFAKFQERVDFGLTKFQGGADFHEAQFQGAANFLVIFLEDKGGESVLNFSNATFKENFGLSFQAIEKNKKNKPRQVAINIQDTKFLSYTKFDISNLKNIPNFGSAFISNIDHLDLIDKERTKEVLEIDEDNARLLKKYYKEKLDSDKSHFYFTLELEEKKERLNPLEKLPYWLYHQFSNYGKSIIRPMIYLFLFSLIFTWVNMPNDKYFVPEKNLSNDAVLVQDKLDCSGCILAKKLKVSFYDSFSRIAVFSPILTKNNKAFDSRYYSRLGVTIQTFLNIVLWFLLLLGVKNKFQIK